MTTIMRSDPFREVLSLRRAMDQLFEQSFIQPSLIPGSSSLMVPMDVCETQNGYEVDVALPGVRPEDIELMVEQNTLTIRGHYSHQNEHQDQPQGQKQTHAQVREESMQAQPQPQNVVPSQHSEQGEARHHLHKHTWLSREIISGSFERTVSFPNPIDPNTIQTIFQNGILTIQVPVSEASRPKRIRITGNQSQSEPKTIEAGQQQR
ncbi:MAG: Hsp20/alpha crystallin family protein [Ktedonobacteraceae bacterium]